LIDQNTSLLEGVFVNFFGIGACANTAFAKDCGTNWRGGNPRLSLWLELSSVRLAILSGC